MENSDLIMFFKKVNKLTSFERKKKIYDLTNDLDIYLLSDLVNEAKLFYLNKIEKRYFSSLKKKNKNSELEDFGSKIKFNAVIDERVNDSFKEALTANSFGDKKDVNFWFDYFLDDCGVDLIGDIIEESSLFLYELNELTIRARKLSKNKEFHNINNEDEVIDFSDSTISSKIIFLQRLGIIDFLRNQNPFNTSVNSIATVLSAVTGGNPSTIQSMVNPILSENVSNKNNPMKSVNSVKVVENKLTQIGFNFLRTNK